jgi:hypothetical protein
MKTLYNIYAYSDTGNMLYNIAYCPTQLLARRQLVTVQRSFNLCYHIRTVWSTV